MEKFRVLVVDDEEDFLETIVKTAPGPAIWRQPGFSAGSRPCNFWKARTWDVVVLDVRMPGMDGIETLKEIKKRKPTVEVIMLTGHASVESGIQGMQLGGF
jgi:two-component system OmpR family response regulator